MNNPNSRFSLSSAKRFRQWQWWAVPGFLFLLGFGLWQYQSHPEWLRQINQSQTPASVPNPLGEEAIENGVPLPPIDPSVTKVQPQKSSLSPLLIPTNNPNKDLLGNVPGLPKLTTQADDAKKTYNNSNQSPLMTNRDPQASLFPALLKSPPSSANNTRPTIPSALQKTELSSGEANTLQKSVDEFAPVPRNYNPSSIEPPTQNLPPTNPPLTAVDNNRYFSTNPSSQLPRSTNSVRENNVYPIGQNYSLPNTNDGLGGSYDNPNPNLPQNYGGVNPNNGYNPSSPINNTSQPYSTAPNSSQNFNNNQPTYGLQPAKIPTSTSGY
jgi:hypothetical protein